MDKSAVSEAAPTSSILEPMNLHNATEFDELLRQRVLCGWDFAASDLEAWRAAADARTMSMFWVVAPAASPGRLSAPQRYRGHVMTQRKTEPSDHGRDDTVQHLFNLFVLPEHRRGGLGRAAIRELEYGSPGCKAITLNALSKRYIEDDGPEGREMYAKVCTSLGIELPDKGSSNEEWYARMGFVKLNEQPMYPVLLEGREILLNAVSMRKPLV